MRNLNYIDLKVEVKEKIVSNFFAYLAASFLKEKNDYSIVLKG